MEWGGGGGGGGQAILHGKHPFLINKIQDDVFSLLLTSLFILLNSTETLFTETILIIRKKGQAYGDKKYGDLEKNIRRKRPHRQ